MRVTSFIKYTPLSDCIRGGVRRVAAAYDQQRLDAAGGNRLVEQSICQFVSSDEGSFPL